MDELKDYRRIVKDLIREYGQYEPSVGDIRTEVILDESNDHYEVMRAGWDGIHRIHGSYLHIDLHDGKVWIEFDGTYDGVAEELAEAGIPNDRIVLAFKHPEIRPHTGFATA